MVGSTGIALITGSGALFSNIGAALITGSWLPF